MPVGTQATVKALTQSDLEEIGYNLILANTYHLNLRPGGDVLERIGGLHRFMSWNGAILTDSGGFQVFSLASIRRFQQDGVSFQSHIDGSRHLFTPESVIDLQRQFGSNIIMVLDDCPPGDCDHKRLQESLERTHRWAGQSIDYYQHLCESGRIDPEKQKIFGIAQGAIDENARIASLQTIQSMPFDGIAIGGLSVGESREDFYRILNCLAPELDRHRPAYLMGVGTIPDFLTAIRNGIDLFDCVLPTRNARHGLAITSEGRVNIKSARYAEDDSALDPDCPCKMCSRYSRAYIRHLMKAGEMLGAHILSYHNLAFYARFMKMARESIRQGKYLAFEKEWSKIVF